MRPVLYTLGFALLVASLVATACLPITDGS
jgi:hypothetical protein